MQITLQEARRLDSVVFPQVKHLCFTVIRLNFEHEDNQRELLRLSEELNIEFQTLCSYIWLQIYLLELSDSFGDIPTPKEVAQMFNIPLDQFQQYVDRRAEELNDINRADEPEEEAFIPRSEEPTDDELLDDVEYILNKGD